MTTPQQRGFLELERTKSLARALGLTLIACANDKWALEETHSIGAGRWPQSGGESWADILRFLRRRNARTWDGDWL
jgi:hypothetical protein